MNNQAAQTMPELPDSQYRGGNDVFGKEFPLYTAAQMHQYARDYAAMLAAAPAASGAHPDALPDGTLSKSTAKRLAAASVSERARELLVAEYKRDGIYCNHFFDGAPLLDQNEQRALRALEQALTQQRGDGEEVDRDAWSEALELPQGYTVEEFLPGGWHYAWTRADGERMVSGTTWNHPALAAIAAWQYVPATTPQPSADAVREVPDGMVLVPREPTPEMVRAGAIVTDHVTRAIQVYSAMLSAASGEKWVG